MNEQIRQLAQQAGLLPREIGPVVETRHMKKKQQDLEKFARLIVNECATLARSKSDFIIEQALLYGDRDEEVSARATAWQFKVFEQEVKQHFGVEE